MFSRDCVDEIQREAQAACVYGPVADVFVGRGEEIVLHVEAGQVEDRLRGGHLLMGGLVCVFRAHLLGRHLVNLSPSVTHKLPFSGVDAQGASTQAPE